MTYRPPIWGIWSDDRGTMLESGIEDLDAAKERVWIPFDAGDESVLVVPACPVHPDRQLSSIRGRGCQPKLNGDIDHGDVT